MLEAHALVPALLYRYHMVQFVKMDEACPSPRGFCGCIVLPHLVTGFIYATYLLASLLSFRYSSRLFLGWNIFFTSIPILKVLSRENLGTVECTQ